MVAYGTALTEHPERFGTVTALGLDETGFVRLAPYYRTSFITSIVDVGRGQLLDLVEGRGGAGSKEWLKNRDTAWKADITHGTLDLSSAYKAVFTAELPEVTLVADPFHVVKLATSKLDETRRRVQNETLGHRGRKDDPLFRCRRLLTKAEERLSKDGKTKLKSLLEAGDPKGDVATAWHAKEAVRELYSHQDQALAITWLDELAADLRDDMRPPEVRSLGRTLKRWRLEITAWHDCHLSNGPTEAMILWRARSGVFDVADRASFSRRRHILWSASLTSTDSEPAGIRQAFLTGPQFAGRAKGGPVRVQRVIMPVSGAESWTVVDDESCVVEPAERYLAHLAAIERSPNTVRAYAYGLRLWFEFLEAKARDWEGVGAEDLSRFVGWLRAPAENVILLDDRSGLRSEATVNRHLAAVFGLYDFHMRSGLQVAADLVSWRRVSRGSFKPFLHHVTAGRPVRTRPIKLRVTRRLPRTLDRAEITAILGACDHLRDRFLFALLAETGMFSRGLPSASAPELA